MDRAASPPCAACGQLAAAAGALVADGNRRGVALRARRWPRPDWPARAARLRAATHRPAGGSRTAAPIARKLAGGARPARARAGAARARGTDGGGARAPAGALPALALGQLLAPAHDQP